eukprot:scaffold72776_cov69-Phaeocystis_antarctica.AAC.8
MGSREDGGSVQRGSVGAPDIVCASRCACRFRRRPCRGLAPASLRVGGVTRSLEEGLTLVGA